MLMRDVVLFFLDLLVELDRHVKAQVQAQALAQALAQAQAQAQNEIHRGQQQDGSQTAGHDEESDGEVPEGVYPSLYSPRFSCLRFL